MRGVDLGELQGGLPGGHLKETGEIHLGNQSLVLLAALVVEGGQPYHQAPGRVVDGDGVGGHECAFASRRMSSTSWMSRAIEGRLRLTVLSGLRRKTRRRVATCRPSKFL